MKKVLLLITLVLTVNTSFAQKALKILKNDGSITNINVSAVDKITFETPLAIGDTYQGGIIFYLDANGEHGLIAAPSDQSAGIAWCSPFFTLTNAQLDGVGAGEANTEVIIISQGDGFAASICNDLTIGVYTDWYLPSLFELNLMYTNLHLAGLGGFTAAFYWSSTEINTVFARVQSFDNGLQSIGDKSDSDIFRVRAVRAF